MGFASTLSNPIIQISLSVVTVVFPMSLTNANDDGCNDDDDEDDDDEDDDDDDDHREDEGDVT